MTKELLKRPNQKNANTGFVSLSHDEFFDVSTGKYDTLSVAFHKTKVYIPIQPWMTKGAVNKGAYILLPFKK